MTPEQRVLRAKIAANTRWAHTEDRRKATQAARDGQMARFLRMVDPDNQLAPAERQRRAECARTAHMQKMSLASARARAARKCQRKNR